MELRRSDWILVAGLGAMGVLLWWNQKKENALYEKGMNDPNELEWRQRVQEAEKTLALAFATGKITQADITAAAQKTAQGTATLSSKYDRYVFLRDKESKTTSEIQEYNSLQNLLRSYGIIK